MGKVSKTEITGLALLGIIIVGITAAGIGMKGCSGGSGNETPVEVRILDEKMEETGEEQSKIKEERREKNPKTKATKKKKAAGRQQHKDRGNPFEDIVPKD